MWKPIVALGVLLGLACGSVVAQDQPEQGRLYAAGKKAFAGCAACHFVTDPAIPEDADWLKLNLITACISAGELTAETRQALNTFLASPQTLRPLRVDENYRPEANLACGTIQVPATAGSAFLKAERESIRSGTPSKIRLSWKASPAGQTLSIPAGDYKVLGYRFYRPDAGMEAKNAKTWTLSVTDVNGCGDVHVATGQKAVFDFQPVIQGDLLPPLATEDGVKLKLEVRNEKGQVLTLSRAGDICLPQFVILGRNEKELYRGAFENT